MDEKNDKAPGAEVPDAEMPDELIENLQNALKNAENNNRMLQAKYDSIVRRRSIEQLAKEHKFSDPDYLDFLLAKEQISPENQPECEQFITSMRQKSPRYFNNELKSGGGTKMNIAERTEFLRAIQSGDINAMLSFAPEI